LPFHCLRPREEVSAFSDIYQATTPVLNFTLVDRLAHPHIGATDA